MGRKSREKKERKQFESFNITVHEVEDSGSLYRVQEYHPQGSEHMDYDLFKEMRIVAVSPHQKIEDLLVKLINKYPTRRFAIAVGKDYIPGDHDIPIFAHPPLNEKEVKEVSS